MSHRHKYNNCRARVQYIADGNLYPTFGSLSIDQDQLNTSLTIRCKELAVMNANLLTEIQDEKQRCRSIEKLLLEERKQADRNRQRVIDLTKRLAESNSKPGSDHSCMEANADA